MSSIRTVDLDGDNIAVGSIRIDTDGLSIRSQSDNWVTLRPTIDDYERFSNNLISTSELRREIATDWIDQGIFSGRRSNYFNDTTRPNNITHDLVFLDMKVENLGGQYKTTVTYIDKKNYQEVKREYFSDVSFTQEFSLSNDNRLNIEIKQCGEITETRKDI